MRVVAYEDDCAPIDPACFSFDGQQVEQRLGGVFVSAVTCIDDGNLGVSRSFGGSASHRVSHNNDIGIVLNSADCVGNGFALPNRRSAHGISNRKYLTAKAYHG